jgi:hypothetical protein
MIKHYSNGTKYLCQTKRDDWETYKGSGNLVKNSQKLILLKTELLGQFETKEELKEMGIFFSTLFNVVEDKTFLNLTNEEGQGGYTSYSKDRNSKISKKLKNKAKTPEHREKLSEKAKGQVMAWDKDNNVSVKVSKEEFENNPNLVGIASVKAKGIPKSEDWKQKMRVPNPKKGEARKGKPPGNSKKILCEGIEFPSVKSAAIHYNKDRRWIEKRLQDSSNLHFTYI